MLFPSQELAELCAEYLSARESSATAQAFRICALAPSHISQRCSPNLHRWLSLYAVMFPHTNFSIAKSFWQHTGLGISSRRAEFLHELFKDGDLVDINGDKVETEGEHDRPDVTKPPSFISERSKAQMQVQEKLKLDESVKAKLVIRERIARSISSEIESHRDLHISDVYLYETGMSAIFSVHRMLLAVQGHLKSVCYGYESDRYI